MPLQSWTGKAGASNPLRRNLHMNQPARRLDLGLTDVFQRSLHMADDGKIAEGFL